VLITIKILGWLGKVGSGGWRDTAAFITEGEMAADERQRPTVSITLKRGRRTVYLCSEFG